MLSYLELNRRAKHMLTLAELTRYLRWRTCRKKAVVVRLATSFSGRRRIPIARQGQQATEGWEDCMAKNKAGAYSKELLDQLLAGRDPKTVLDSGDLIADLKKALAERMVNAEMDVLRGALRRARPLRRVSVVPRRTQSGTYAICMLRNAPSRNADASPNSPSYFASGFRSTTSSAPSPMFMYAISVVNSS